MWNETSRATRFDLLAENVLVAPRAEGELLMRKTDVGRVDWMARSKLLELCISTFCGMSLSKQRRESPKWFR